MIYTLWKDFLAATTLKVCKMFVFGQSNKVYSILWSVRVFLAFLEKRRRNRHWLREEYISFSVNRYLG